MSLYTYGRSPFEVIREDLVNFGNRSVIGMDGICECNKPKPTQNDKTAKALDEISYATKKVRELLSAADKLKDKRVSEVLFNGHDAVVIKFAKIDADADKAKAEKVEDAATHGAMNATRQNLATSLSGLLHNTGRTMLTLVAVATSKIVSPELSRMNEARSGAEQGGNVTTDKQIREAMEAKLAAMKVKENAEKANS